MIVEELVQGSENWLRYKQKTLGSSEAAVILGISPWNTPYGLWKSKTGRAVKEFRSNPSIDRGNRWEPAARARYELKTGIDLPPVVKEHPRYKFIIASLDGYSEEKQIIIEIKCITSRKTLEMAQKEGTQQERVIPHYYSQVQHQLMTTGAKEAHFFVCLIEKVGHTEQITEEALVIVKPDEEYQKNLLMKEIEFYNFMQQDIPPPLSDRDYLEADDQSTVLLFSRVKEAKLALQAHAAEIERLANESLLIRTKLQALVDATKPLEEAFEELREEAKEQAESLGHCKISASGINMIKNKTGSWSIRLASEGDTDAR